MLPDTLDLRSDFDARRVTVSGVLVLSTLSAFVQTLSLLIDLNPGTVTVDLTDVERVDGAAFGCLAVLHRRLLGQGSRLVVVASRAHRDQLFDPTNLLRLASA